GDPAGSGICLSQDLGKLTQRRFALHQIHQHYPRRPPAGISNTGIIEVEIFRRSSGDTGKMQPR
ncbi:MAG: hypothetical protein ACJ786_07940, partial [Catenulispora sp.]